MLTVASTSPLTLYQQYGTAPLYFLPPFSFIRIPLMLPLRGLRKDAHSAALAGAVVDK